MKKRLLSFVLLLLGMTSIDARNSLFTSEDTLKTKKMPTLQEKKAQEDRELRTKQKKEHEKKIRKERAKREREQKKRLAERKKQDRKKKIKVERKKAQQEKEKKAKQPKPKLTKEAARIVADASNVQAELHKSNARATKKNIEMHQEVIKQKKKAQRDRVVNMTQKEQESHLLNVRFAPTAEARDKAKQASCEAHGTCETAEVQDMLAVIKANRAQLTLHNKKHENAKAKARAHHVKAGTMDQYEKQRAKKFAHAVFTGKEEHKGDHRLSNTHEEVKDHLDAMGYKKPMSVKDAKKSVHRADNAMDKAKKAHKKRIIKDRKKRAKQREKVKSVSYNSKW